MLSAVGLRRSASKPACDRAQVNPKSLCAADIVSTNRSDLSGLFFCPRAPSLTGLVDQPGQLAGGRHAQFMTTRLPFVAR